MDIILASESRSRRDLLARLGVDFKVQISGFDETPRGGETIVPLVKRLALGKARTVAATNPQALIIGSDQTACTGGEILHKPADADAAKRQLALCSGSAVEFHTCVCLLDAAADRYQIKDVTTTVLFRKLGEDEIARYVAHDKPFDCAGSVRSETLGITLLERIESEDPTALLGLPLIALCAMFRQTGINLP